MMFGFDPFSIAESVASSVQRTAGRFVDDPIGTTVDIATQPIHDTVEVLEGLSEGELRTYAATRLGADVVSGMVVSEIIEALSD